MKQRKRKSNDKQLVVLSDDDDECKVTEKELFKRKPRVCKENKIENKKAAAAIKKRRKGKEKADVVCVEDESDNRDDQLQDDDYQPKSEDEEPEEEEEEILAEQDALSNNTCPAIHPSSVSSLFVILNLILKNESFQVARGAKLTREIEEIERSNAAQGVSRDGNDSVLAQFGLFGEHDYSHLQLKPDHHARCINRSSTRIPPQESSLSLIMPWPISIQTDLGVSKPAHLSGDLFAYLHTSIRLPYCCGRTLAQVCVHAVLPQCTDQ